MKHLALPLEIKSLSDTGSFSGYASIFGNVDLGGDVVERGAFKELVKNADGKVTVLWQHKQDMPIGIASIEQDDTGLRFDGELVLDDPIARKAHAHMKAKSVRGMSMGYDVLAGGAEILKSGVRRLKALKLWEISVVTFGMNPLAGVDAVKAAGQINTIREFEDWLRDEGGFSWRQAKQIASAGFKALDEPQDVAGSEQIVKSLADVVTSALSV